MIRREFAAIWINIIERFYHDDNIIELIRISIIIGKGKLKNRCVIFNVQE